MSYRRLDPKKAAISYKDFFQLPLERQEELLNSDQNKDGYIESGPLLFYDIDGSVSYVGISNDKARPVFPRDVIKKKPELVLKHLASPATVESICNAASEKLVNKEVLDTKLLHSIIYYTKGLFEMPASPHNLGLKSFNLELTKKQKNNVNGQESEIETIGPDSLLDIRCEVVQSDLPTTLESDFDIKQILIVLLIAFRASGISSKYNVFKQRVITQMAENFIHHLPKTIKGRTDVSMSEIIDNQIPSVQTPEFRTFACSLSHLFTIEPTHKLVNLASTVITCKNRGFSGYYAMIELNKELKNPEISATWMITKELRDDWRQLCTRFQEMDIHYSYARFMMDYGYTNTSVYSTSQNPAITFLLYGLKCTQSNSTYYNRTIDQDIASEKLMNVLFALILSSDATADYVPGKFRDVEELNAVTNYLNDSESNRKMEAIKNSNELSMRDTTTLPTSSRGTDWFVYLDSGGKISYEHKKPTLTKWSRIPSNDRVNSIGQFLRGYALQRLDIQPSEEMKILS